MDDNWENIMASGFKLIKEMTPDELLDEICQGQREQLSQMKIEQLRSVLIDYRIGIYRKRLIIEAGFEEGAEY